jgi:hypothetical protein
MRNVTRFMVIGLAIAGLFAAVVCPRAWGDQTAGDKGAATKEISQEELAASVPALSALHKVVYPLWHSAYAEKNYALIKELLPQADTLIAKLDEAALPGILREKQERWEGGKANLKSALKQLHGAAEANSQEEMLKQTEAFHAAYERLVRTIRPIVPELEAFHQEMYKLYHYYAPEYDLAQIRSTAAAMREKIAALKEAQLPKRLADRQERFQTAVKQLEATVNSLNETVKADVKEKILAAVEKVHVAYQQTEKLFD